MSNRKFGFKKRKQEITEEADGSILQEIARGGKKADASAFANDTPKEEEISPKTNKLKLEKVDNLIVATHDSKVLLYYKDATAKKIKNYSNNSSYDMSGNIEDMCFGWVNLNGIILPTYNVDVYEDKNNGGYYLIEKGTVPEHDDSVVKFKDSKSVNILNSEIVSKLMSEVLTYNGKNFVPGRGLKFVGRGSNVEIVDVSNERIFKHTISMSDTDSLNMYTNSSNIPFNKFGFGIPDTFMGDTSDNVEYKFEFKFMTNNTIMLSLIATLDGKTFKIPKVLLSEVKSIKNKIENGSASLSLINKLAEIIKINFAMVNATETARKEKIILPDELDEIYSEAGMTEEQYNELTQRGVTISLGEYGALKIVEDIKNGNITLSTIINLLNIINKED